MDNCPFCGGQKSAFLNPLSTVVLKVDARQECLTCGMRVEYWPRVERLQIERIDLAATLRRALRRMRQYEMDVDDSPPKSHRQFLQEADELLKRVNSIHEAASAAGGE